MANDELMLIECDCAVAAAKVALDMYELGLKDECARAVSRVISSRKDLAKYPSHKRRVRMAIAGVDAVLDLISGKKPAPKNDELVEYEIIETDEEARDRKISTARRALSRATERG